MEELDELYQEIILGHNKRPRNEGVPDHTTHRAEGYNPLCGDHVTVHLDVRDGVVEDVRFTSQSCAIARASSSIMTEAVKGLPVGEVRKKIDEAVDLLQGPAAEGAGIEGVAPQGDMAALAGVRRFPARVKCATLAWHTLGEALDHPCAEPDAGNGEKEGNG